MGSCYTRFKRMQALDAEFEAAGYTDAQGNVAFSQVMVLLHGTAA